MFLFGRKTADKQEEPKINYDITLHLSVIAEVTYKEAEGLFLYNDEVFYKAKNGTGKNIKTGESFSDFYIKANENVNTKVISTVIVKLLDIV